MEVKRYKFWIEEDDYNKGHDFVKESDYLSLQAERDDLRESQRWIPVTERLPDVVGHYLIFGLNGEADYIGWGFYNTNKQWVDFGTQSFHENVTHWQLLPDAPKAPL